MVKAKFLAASAALLSTALAQNHHPYGGQIVMYSTPDIAQRMDPIISPGILSQHVHLMFGSNTAAPGSDYDSLQATTCTTVGEDGDGNKDDNSLYWHPALYMVSNNGSGYIRVPTGYHKLYYTDHGSLKDNIIEPFEFPKGHRMLANSPFQRAPLPEAQQNRVTQWYCHTENSNTDLQNKTGGFPTGVTGCHYGFAGALHFPHCWDGQPYDPANPFAHTVYPDGDPESGECPDSHKTRLPHIFMENYFDIDSIAKDVVPGSFVLAQGDNTGYGFHADFLNGWVSGGLSALFNRCNKYNSTQGIAGCDDPPHTDHKAGVGGFNRNGVNPDTCKIPVTFVEEVDRPGKFLPGCNPIIDTNPAPIMAIAGLNVATDICQPAGGNDAPAPSNSAAASSALSSAPSSSSAAAQAAAYSMPAYSAPAAYSSVQSSASHSPGAAQASSSTSASLKCPGDDGRTYTSSNGKVFQVECGVDHTAGNLDMLYANSLSDCIDACASHGDCVDVSLSGTACWMKKSLGAPVQRGEVSGAKLVTGSSGSASPTLTTSLLTTTSLVATSTHGGALESVIEYITEVVTITATGFPAMPTIKARDEHIHRHARYHVGRRDF